MELEFGNLLIVAAAAFLAPLTLGLAPGLRLPAVVLEIVAGIVLGPSVLGVVEIDPPVEVLALLGLAFLLFLAGLEVDPDALRGRALELTALGFVISLAIGVGAGALLATAGLADAPLFIGVVLSATSLGVVLTVLKDADLLSTRFGQTIIAAASVADFGAIVLLTLLFSSEGTSTTTRLILLACFVGLVGLAALVVIGAERSKRISGTLLRLQDTTAQIRVRGSVLLLAGFAFLAAEFGLEVILGAFAAGAVLTIVDKDAMRTHPLLRTKLEAIGFGFLIPVFFVSSGIAFDLQALTASSSALVAVPAFLAALLLARGLPVVLYRSIEPQPRRLAAAALLQATSLPFIVTAAMIGQELGLVDAATGAGLIAAGLLSVLLFPLAATTLLDERTQRADRDPRGAGDRGALDVPQGAA